MGGRQGRFNRSGDLKDFLEMEPSKMTIGCFVTNKSFIIRNLIYRGVDLRKWLKIGDTMMWLRSTHLPQRSWSLGIKYYASPHRRVWHFCESGLQHWLAIWRMFPGASLRALAMRLWTLTLDFCTKRKHRRYRRLRRRYRADTKTAQL